MSWSTVTLGELIEIKHGFAFKGKFFSDEGQYILLTPGNCHESGGLKLKGSKEKYYIGDIPEDYLLSAGDLLVVMTDLVNTAPILGGAFIIPEDQKFLHNQRLGLVTLADDRRIHKRFLYYLLNTNNYRGQVRGSASGATVRHTSPDRIKQCKVRIPNSIEEQGRIASILSAYDDLLENNRRRIQLLEHAAQQLYQEWFVRLRFPGHEHVSTLDGVPEGWAAGVVSDFYSTGSGGTPSRKNQDFFTGEIPWVKTRELNGGFILSTEERITDEAVERSSAKIFPRQTVLIEMYGATIGESAILSEPSATNQACCAVVPKEPGTSFAHVYLFFRQHKTELIGLGQGSAQNNVSQQVIKSFTMVLPRKELLESFAESSIPFFDQIETLQRSNFNLTQARNLLLPRLMNGVLAV